MPDRDWTLSRELLDLAVDFRCRQVRRLLDDVASSSAEEAEAHLGALENACAELRALVEKRAALTASSRPSELI